MGADVQRAAARHATCVNVCAFACLHVHVHVCVCACVCTRVFNRIEKRPKLLIVRWHNDNGYHKRFLAGVARDCSDDMAISTRL